MAQDTFKRVEIKYLLSENQYRRLRERLEPFMQEDQYGISKISSIYFDTEGYDIIRESLEKPAYKEKLRLRCYGEVSDDTKAFLELKKKYKGVVYKRRIELTYKEALDYIEKGIMPQKQSQIFKEIDYFFNYYKPTQKTYIEYYRVALFGREDNQLRVTFDKDICAKFNEGSLVNVVPTNRVIEEGTYLMEIKGTMAMPHWLSSLLAELEIYPDSFSKYGAACLNNELLF